MIGSITNNTIVIYDDDYSCMKNSKYPFKLKLEDICF